MDKNKDIKNTSSESLSAKKVDEILSDIDNINMELGESISFPENILSIQTTEIESDISSIFSDEEMKDELNYKNQEVIKDNMFINKIYNILNKSHKNYNNVNNNVIDNNPSILDSDKPVISVDLNESLVEDNGKINNMNMSIQSSINDDLNDIKISNHSCSITDENSTNNSFHDSYLDSYNFNDKIVQNIENNQQCFDESSLKNFNKYKDNITFDIESNKKTSRCSSSGLFISDQLEKSLNSNNDYKINKNIVGQLTMYLDKFKVLEATIEDLELSNKEYRKKNMYIRSKFLSLKEKNKILEKDLKQTKKINDENSKKLEKLLTKNEQNYIKTNNDNTILISDLNCKIRKLSNQLDKCKNKEKEYIKNITEKETQIENYESIIESTNTKNKKLQESLENAEININSISINNDKIKNHMNKLMDENQHLTSNNDSLQKEIIAIKESYNSISCENSNLKEKLNVYNKESKIYENKINQLEKESLSLNKLTSDLTKEKDSLNEQCVQLKNDCIIIKNKYNNLLIIKDETEESVKKLKQDLNSSNNKYSELNSKTQHLQKLNNDLEIKNNQLDCELNNIIKTNKDLKHNVQKLENDISTLESENRDLKFKLLDMESLNYCQELSKNEIERQIKYLKIHYNIDDGDDDDDDDNKEKENEITSKYIETIKNLKTKNNELQKANLSLINVNNNLKRKLVNLKNQELPVHNNRLNHCRSRSLDSCLINNKSNNKNENLKKLIKNKSNQDLVNNIKSLKSLFQNFLKVEMENLNYNKYEKEYKQSNKFVETVNSNINFIESFISQYIKESGITMKNKKDVIINKKVSVTLQDLRESYNNNQKFLSSVYGDYNKLYLKFKEFIQVFHDVFNLCDEYILFENSEGMNNYVDSINFSSQLKNLENQHDILLNEYENYKMKMDTDLRDKKTKIKKQLKEMKKMKKSYTTQKNTIMNLKNMLNDYKKKYEVCISNKDQFNGNNDDDKKSNSDYESIIKSKSEEIQRLQELCNSITNKEAENIKVLLNKIKRTKIEIKNKNKIINEQKERLNHFNKTLTLREKEKEQKNTELQFTYSQLSNLMKSYKLLKQERDSLSEELSTANKKLNKIK
ncbi:hypothetical protein BCR36DRAFT_451362 [Piromyces finnis]|uniref:Uncharacterized protein n=1 Tax=Piromyces finnis TaxID=1754191 RepID=A0A1Y1V7R6_9FUNG|nr:hypothetical protein BCR36DRAFT_451362 [Piromyces finnis]|eukprot:ORX48641.1 hypothetical protein BCR36DRAFT_451362 [Piromyces finnis]